MQTSIYVSNFDYETLFWKFTTGSQKIHNICIKGKDSSWKIAQLKWVEKLQYVLLVIIDNDYWEITILISTKNRDKLRAGLKTDDILKVAWNLTNLNIDISMLVKWNFVDFMVRIMPDDKCKANVHAPLCNKTYLFTYDIKTIQPGQFSDLGIFHVDNFQICINVAIEV